MVMTLTFLSVLFLIQQIGAASLCNAPEVWHYDGTESRCCQPVICPPGMEPVICTNSSRQSFCVSCPDGRFNSENLSSVSSNGNMFKCKSHRTCDEKHQLKVSNGSATQDVVCQCKDEAYWQIGTDGKCIATCPPGEYSLEGQESCYRCSNGTFKNVPGREQCLQCTVCNVTETECNATNDAICVPDSKSSTENGNNFAGWKICLIVVCLILGSVVAVLIIVNRKQLKRKFFASDSQRSQPSPDAAENQPMLTPSDGVNASSGQNASSTQQRRKWPKCCWPNGGSSHPSAEDGLLLTARTTDPENGASQPGLRNGQPCGGNNNQPAGSTAHSGASMDQSQPNTSVEEPGPGASGEKPGPGASGEKPGSGTSVGKPGPSANGEKPGPSASGEKPGPGANGEKPVLGANGEKPGPSANGEKPGPGANGEKPGPSASGEKPVLGANGEKPVLGDNGEKPGPSASGEKPVLGANGEKPGPGANGEKPGPGASLEQHAYTSQLDAGMRQPSGGASLPHSSSSGDSDPSQEGLHLLNAPQNASSLCSGNQLNPQQSLQPASEESRRSSVPGSLHSDQSAPQGNHNFNLQSDPFVAESKVEKYIRRLQENYSNVQKMFYLGQSLIDSLYEPKFLTFELMTEMRALRHKPNGSADALVLIQKRLYELGDKAARPFLEALIHPETRLDALAVHIDPELAEELIKKRDDPNADSASDAIAASRPDPGLPSSQDDVDYVVATDPNAKNPNKTTLKTPLSAENDPNETTLKTPLSAENDQNETPVKEVETSDVSPQTSQTEETWNDPGAPADDSKQP